MFTGCLYERHPNNIVILQLSKIKMNPIDRTKEMRM